MITRKKSDVLDIPEQYEVPTIKVKMSPEQRDIYEAFSNYVFDKVKNESMAQDVEATSSLLHNFSFAML
jgi:SNF2 family DNA or RNA helicase